VGVRWRRVGREAVVALADAWEPDAARHGGDGRGDALNDRVVLIRAVERDGLHRVLALLAFGAGRDVDVAQRLRDGVVNGGRHLGRAAPRFGRAVVDVAVAPGAPRAEEPDRSEAPDKQFSHRALLPK